MQKFEKNAKLTTCTQVSLLTAQIYSPVTCPSVHSLTVYSTIFRLHTEAAQLWGWFYKHTSM